MPIEDIKVTPIEKNNIKTKATIPLNPTAQGWSGEQVRNRILQGSVGETDSVLSLLESKMDIVHNFIANIYDGDIDSVLIFDTYETMVASTPKTNILYLVKTPTALYYYDSEFKELYSVDTYTKDETYNQTEIDAFNLLKANASEVFSKEETYNRDTINDLVADVPNKANIVILQSITTQPATATTNQIYYNANDKKIYLYDGSDWGTSNVGANGILYMFGNVLYVYNTYDGLIKIGQKPAAFNTLYVDSLSSNNNDFNYLTVENQIIANSGIDVKSHKIINVQDPTANQDAATKKYVDDSITTSEGNLDNYYTKVQTYSQDEINTLIASNYKAKGNLAPGGLVAGLLIAANLGNVYNITGQFTTTTNFLEGPGIIHKAGENVAIVEYSAGVYKFDVLSSFVDLSGYVEKDGTKVLSDNNFTTTLKDKLDGAEITSNKVIAWSETTNDTRYASEKLVKDSLDELENTIQGVSDLSPYHYEGTFLANDTMQSLLRPLEAGGGDDTFVTSKLKGAMFVCETAGAFDFSNQYTWSEEVGAGSTRVDTIIYNFLPPYQDDSLLPSTNFKIKDVITIVNFQFGGLSPRTITLTMQVEKNLEENFVLKNDTITGATKPKITYDAKGLVTAGADLIADDIPAHNHTKSEITDFPTTPTVPTISTDITTDATSDIKTASPKAVKSYVDNAISTVIGDIEDLLEAI